MDFDKILNPISDMIYKSYEDKQTGHRPHMGGSQIGNKCDKYLWLTFRTAYENNFPGRVLRLFQRGQNEEAVIVQNLRDIGCTVWEEDSDGKQFSWSHGGHIKGSLDGVGIIPTYGTKPHLLEFKTASDKKYKEMDKNGLEKANPVYYTQVQVYMYKMELERALFIMVNKNDDQIYTERVKIDKDFAKKQLDRAQKIVDSPEPPQGISDNPAWFECKFCSASKVCHKIQYPVKNCRTCVHSSPAEQGWICEKNNKFGTVCNEHLFIPPLISNDYEMKDGCIYHNLDGKIIVNCTGLDFPKITDETISEII